ncbi:hypothetical protein [Myroides marinus]|uniref:hypothetical protein n=2 Tax=Myroides marinus TaxID=703342 RepID=UPI00257638EB|nr:hypothetical protein [Myroides marinus]MDM1353203.1 hypothetical protein [Myroides marinus]MDM1533940.1 hypothetical protein [Myroides marinus]MDM1540906.1 hypothetical protein [Myroides marinus]
MIRNGEVVSEESWINDTLAWKTIYIEERGKMYYCPNPYLYEESISLFMKYHYNEKNQEFTVISYENNPNKPDTIPVQINNLTDKSMQWEMIFNKDTLQMDLKKVNPREIDRLRD